jgi:threonine/homoserine/homoserine lactone efflux protein
MGTNTFLTFIWLAIAVLVIPGPSILLIVSNSIKLGIGSGLYTVAGTSVAMLIQLAIAVFALTSVIGLRADLLNSIRWIGIAILCYLGVRRWNSRDQSSTAGPAPRDENRSALAEGFFVSLTNPTTMAFFVAFFPQFLDPTGSLPQQLLLMSAIFWLLALPVDLSYALLAGRLGNALQNAAAVRLRNRASGTVLLAAAAWMALTKI